MTDASFVSTFMINVDPAAYRENLTLTFRNCIFDVRGRFLRSTVPVNIVFDSCVFNVLNTTTLLSLDYSAGSKFGCTGFDTDGGDLEIKNS